MSNILDMIKQAQAPAIRIEGRTAGAIRPMGYATIISPEGDVGEWDTMMCMHCQYHWRVIQGSGKERGWCTKCDGALCGQAKCFVRCEHYEKMIERVEARGRMSRNMEMLRR